MLRRHRFATCLQALRRVLLPLATPGILSGALMVFVMSLGYFVTPSLLGGTANMMLAEFIAQFVQSLVNWDMGTAVITLGLCGATPLEAKIRVTLPAISHGLSRS
ncbi:MAG: hypothetical protein U1E40_05045 [Amaricoccus sp.]